MSRETKTLHFQVKATGIATNDAGQEVGQIEAYGAVFNNVDEGNDRILPNAFKRTIKNSKERAQTRKKNYFISMLWNHDTDHFMPIGGWHDVKEDDFGLLCKGDVLLATQTGHDYYELARAGMVDQFSIIYDVPQGGAKYDKSGVRELSEIRLFSIDPVVFAMNDATYMVGVKSLETKSICGNTSGPIGARDESWSGSKAEKQIWAAAEKDDGSINASLAKKYFMVCDGDAQKKGSYSYPFWYVGSDPHICVGAVKAIAGAISGACGSSAPDGLKSKVETLYNRINKKYPDDPQLTPPWEDDGKSQRRRMEKKTLLEHYNEEMAQDLLEDWQDVYVCTLTKAVLDALKIGDQPAQDISQALDDFKELVMSKFVTQAVEVGLSDYLEENETSYSSADSTMHNGSSSYYGYMSRQSPLQGKAGGMSQSKKDTIQEHIDGIHAEADSHLAAAKKHAKALHTAADDLATVLQGSEAAYGTDHGKPEDDQQEGKRASFSSRTRTHREPSSQSGDTVSDDELSEGLSALKSLRIVNLA
jgi:HK97 family phage prohead protease